MGACIHCGKETHRFAFVDAWDEEKQDLVGWTQFECGCTDPVPTEFGKALRKWRMDNTVSLRDVAEKTQLSIAKVSAFERGSDTPDPVMAGWICVALGVALPKVTA